MAKTMRIMCVALLALEAMVVPLLPTAAQKQPAGSPGAEEIADALRAAFASMNATDDLLGVTVRSAQGGSPSGGALGSGDNLLAFRDRVQQLKGYYKDARNYLGADDAVRIGGYISKLTQLETGFVDAFPIAEISYFTALLSLSGSVTGLIYEILRDTGANINFATKVLKLAIAVEEARRAANAGTWVPMNLRAAGDGGDPITAALSNNQQLLGALVNEAQGLNEQVLPWVLNGGPLGPMALATNILAATADSLRQLESYDLPVGLWSPILPAATA